jgi:hypothetical protein
MTGYRRASTATGQGARRLAKITNGLRAGGRHMRGRPEAHIRVPILRSCRPAVNELCGALQANIHKLAIMTAPALASDASSHFG